MLISSVAQNQVAIIAAKSNPTGFEYVNALIAATSKSATAFLTNPFRDTSDETAPVDHATRNPVAKSMACKISSDCRAMLMDNHTPTNRPGRPAISFLNEGVIA